MRIGILTQPLHINYGGLLQAYALQQYLIGCGHEPLTANITDKVPRAFAFKQKSKDVVKKYLLGRTLPNQHTRDFVRNNIRQTRHFTGESDLKKLNDYHFDAYIVGSDQVWRPFYSPRIGAYFLDFVEDKRVKKISYAASFGVDHCNEFSRQQLQDYGQRLQQFDAVSVREQSAVALCRKYFDVQAENVLDPTLLLTPADYIALIEQEPLPQQAPELMCYVLDKSKDKLDIIKRVSNKTELSARLVTLDEQAVCPKVSQWLQYFYRAGFVVTDSFHGVVFSILFNKPFIAIGNPQRGLARFSSLLGLFSLESRLVSSPDEVSDALIDTPIDYPQVNAQLAKERAKAQQFLTEALRGQHG